MRKDSGNSLTVIVISVLILALLGFGAWYMVTSKSVRSTIPTPSPSPTEIVKGSQNIFDMVEYKLPDANWSVSAPAKQQTMYGNLTGVEITGELDSKQAQIPHFENPQSLEDLGFKPDNDLSADGPGSSVWGYKKQESGMSQIITLSYSTKPTSSNPNEPLQFNCPCKISVSAFISSPFENKK